MVRQIVFRRQRDLAPLYETITRTAVHAVKVEHVATFLGRKLNGNHKDELGNAEGRSPPAWLAMSREAKSQKQSPAGFFAESRPEGGLVATVPQRSGGSVATGLAIPAGFEPALPA